MALEISVYDEEEFEKLIEKDFRISDEIVSTVLKNLEGKKRHFHIFSILVESSHIEYEITVDREDFQTVLEKHLPIMEYHEKYEICAEMVKALNKLKSPPKKKKRGRPPKKKVEEN